MLQFIKDARKGISSFVSAYLTLILPASIAVALLAFGATLVESDGRAGLAVIGLAGLFYATLPALMVTHRGSISRLARFKAWLLSAGDALFVGALVYFAFTYINPTTAWGAFAVSVAAGSSFLAFCVLTLRGLRLVSRTDRGSLLDDFKVVWKGSHVFLLLVAVGLVFPIITGGGIIWLQTSGLLQNPSLQQVVGLTTLSTIVIPATFMPFTLLAEGLKRVGLDQDKPAAEAVSKE
jgi:uncharacterized membrane protein YgdD (TMEM256/DUF423 family)